MDLTPEEFHQIQLLIHQLSGLALTPDKQYLVKSRLEPLCSKYACKSFGELGQRLLSYSDGGLRQAFIEAMTTHETSFNRDTHPFEELRRTLIPRMIETLRTRRERSGIPFPRARIWSVASSTGQEPYSIAMALLDYFSEHKLADCSLENFAILATDISEHALQGARIGSYTHWETERGLTTTDRQRHFTRQGQQWTINPDVRKLVEFQKLNVLHSFADLSGFDLILCRNLLIYFDEPTRVAVCQKLASSLNPQGILIIGSAEQLPRGLEASFLQQTLGQTVIYLRK